MSALLLLKAGGPSSSWTPQDLFTAGVTGAWYQVSPTYCYQERGGGTTACAVGDVVGTIRDQSGTNAHLSPPSDAARGTLQQEGSNYYVSFDGVDDTYATTATFTWAYPSFVGATMQKAVQSSIAGMISFWASASNYVGVTNISPNSRVAGAHRNATQGPFTANSATNSVPVATTKVLQVAGATNSIKLQVNADTEVETTTAFDPANFTGSPPILVFRVATDAARFYGGIFLLNKSMSTTDRNNARTWLGNLGGLSI